MVAASPQPQAFDSSAMIETIRGLLDRSPVFRGAQISLPQAYLGGEVSVAVGFGGGPALLYEFARSLVEMEDRRHRQRLA